MIIVFVGLAFYAKISTVSSARIVQGPSNVAVVVGNSVSLWCKPNSTDISVTWYQIPVHSRGIPSSQIRPMNNGFAAFRNFSEYSFGGSAPGEVLSLNYTRLSHAGLYRCIAGSQQATAQLTVLAWEPNCSFTFDRSLLHLSCIVMYNGDWIPSMQWLETMANGTESRTISESNCSKPSNNAETFNHSTRFHFESLYVFKLNFANRNCIKTNSTATNIPNYEYTWKLKNTQIFLNVLTNVTASSEPYNVHIRIDESSTKGSMHSSSDELNLTVLIITLTAVPLLLIGFVVLIACIVVAKKRKGSAKKTATANTELTRTPTSTRVTTLVEDGYTVTAHSSYEEIYLNTELPTKARDDASTNVENIDSNSAGGVSIRKVSDDSSSDSNSSRKRSRYEALLERSPMVKRIYLSLKKSQQREQDTQASDSSSSSSVAIMSESPVYVNAMQVTVTK